ncbi:hypothetical protein [Bradyrhizobium sp. USDA 3364]
MLGNCIIRTPVGADARLDVGVLCEALLFFSKTHVVLDLGTLRLFTENGFLDDFIEMLERGYVSASFMPDTPVLFSESTGGLRQHFFTMFRVVSDPQHGPIQRPADAMLLQLGRSLGDRGKARSYVRRLSKHLSFRKPDENGDLVVKAVDDLSDPAFANAIARMSLERLGVPPSEIGKFSARIFPTDKNKFAIHTDIDFERLRQFVLATEPTLGPNHLFPAVGDARLDISLAAEHNAAFIGNEGNRRIVEMILSKAIGAAAQTDRVPRAVYDFVSLDAPTVREVINSGERTPREFIELLGSASSFKKWLNEQNPDKDLIQEMLREKTKSGWLEALPVKVARFGLFSAAGFFSDMAIPGSSVALGAVDSFLVGKLINNWRPHFFVENKLRGFLDARRN